MKNKILIVLFSNILLCNSVIDKIDNILYKGIEYNKKQLKILSEEYSKDSNILILKGLSEIDGNSSMNYFLEYMKKSPSGQYAELSISKIAEYYYANAEYAESANWYKKIPDNFPESNRLETSISYYLNALVISNKSDSARFYANKYNIKYPQISSLNKSFLIPDKTTSSNKNKYSVKAGSYDKLSTALYYKNILQKEKFSVLIKEENISDKIIYNLLVGQYKNRNNALSVQKRLLSRLGISNCEIIKLN